MSYYKLLGFNKEPFSTSPDPGFFYLSKEHDSALTNILIELRLKRGLSTVFGDIGTGKTTLSRKLIHELRQRDDFIFFMMFNPCFEDESHFLGALLKNFGIPVTKDYSLMSVPEMMNMVEKFLLQKAVDEGKTLTLIIDEAQKISESILEILRVFLNFETNEYKLFQVVLLGQLELVPKILNMQNFYDRISFKYALNPFDFEDTKKMIEYRIACAGYRSERTLFTDGAIDEIHRYTMGYPRRITMICHKALKEIIIEKRDVVSKEMIKELIHRESEMLRKVSAIPKAAY